MENKIILVLCCLFPTLMFSQWGCTDPQATNYSQNATINDGSCTYPTTNYALNLVANLANVIYETSGLLKLGDKIYTFNDSGASNVIYETDTIGTVLRNIVVQGATNVDWEAISANNTHVYIGDFGNNNGSRHNLCLYQFPINELVLDTVHATKLNFKWQDQLVFTSLPDANNFDCEAMITTNDSIYLFSKNWVNLKTRCYRLPKTWNDTLSVSPVDSFYVDGMITDATYDSISKHLYLLGYKNNGSNFYTSFVWCLWDFPGTGFFSGNKRRIEIGNILNVSQTEGITLKSAYKGYISAEKITAAITIPPKLFEFDFTTFFQSTASLNNVATLDSIQVTNRADGMDEISINFPFKTCDLFDLQGNLLKEIRFPDKTISIAIKGQVILQIDGRMKRIFLP